MTDTKETPHIEPDNWVGGVPLFIMNDGMDDLVDDIREHGCWVYMNEDDDEPVQMFPQVFYLLAEERVSVKTTQGNVQTQSLKYQPRLFKVVANLVGNAIHSVNEGSVGLEDIEQEAYFTLPPIPYSLVNDIDDFFREVYRIHGTESIVILTYEPSYKDTDNPSDGWGILVPDQTNTAASCDYEPDSVVDDMPDDRDVRLVGTAHSHPGMQAFCSGTDARDQAHNDGIHITYGWKKGSLHTEYYIELQMGGGSFVMDPKDVFTDLPEAIDNEKIAEWTKKVKKGTVAGKARGSSQQNSLGSGSGYGTGGNWWSDPQRYKNLPKDCPTPDKVTLVAAPLLTQKELKACPVCDADLKEREIETAKCLRCQCFLMWAELKTLEDIIAHRLKSGMPTHELDVDKDPGPWKSIWIWEEKESKTPGKVVDEVFEYYKGRSETQGTTYAGGSSKK